MEHLKKFYQFTYQNLTKKSRWGNILFDGKDCSGDCFQFKHPTYRYLVKYYQLTKDAQLFQFLRHNIASIWESSNTVNGNYYFPVDWAGSPATLPMVQSQHNSAVSAILLFYELLK